MTLLLNIDKASYSQHAQDQEAELCELAAKLQQDLLAVLRNATQCCLALAREIMGEEPAAHMLDVHDSYAEVQSDATDY